MSPRRWRMAWSVAVGLSQAALTAAAVWLFILPTQNGNYFLTLNGSSITPLPGFESRDQVRYYYGNPLYFYGYPIPWAECHQECAWSWGIVGSVDEWREVSRGPKVVDGWNPALPPVLILTAVSLPPVA